MEERIGELWHRLITRLAQDRYPEAAVRLSELNQTLGILFRAFGGDGGLRVEAAGASEHHARRGLLQRIAGSATRIELAWRDEQALRLPEVIDLFPRASLNRDLYFWLAALAACDPGEHLPWLAKNQQLSRLALERYPGMRARYRRLCEAHLAQRPDPAALRADEAAQEQAIRRALGDPGAVAQLPVASHAPWPVPLWLHPSPPGLAPGGAGRDQENESGGDSQAVKDGRSRRGERKEMGDADGGLITIRMENILSWGEFAKVDRGAEENEDLDQAKEAAEQLEQFSVTRDGESVASKLKFDLDLPSESCDDEILQEGMLLPEWDWKRQLMQPDHCRVMMLQARDAPAMELPLHLKKTAKQLRAQFQQLMPARVWRHGQADGSEIDLEAYLRFSAERESGHQAAADNLYRDLRTGARDLSCLLLADLSLSTDSWIDNHHRVIDVIRDSLYLFAESLSATGDRFGLYGFSSRKRDPVRLHRIKRFDEPYSARSRGRIDAIKPGYYTRMGAAIRYAQHALNQQPAQRRLLLLLSDGKPNDLDKYEGRYGVEDTRQAIREARGSGIQPFCVTIDEKGNDYLPYLFGSGGYVVIHKPQELPRKLPLLYARLTRE
ncbi:MAG: VWA domain-containing protein [Candidatus Thiodiazotropha sp.]|nr:VWA domain-containing protein [Candidatus Thiodiazotropha taylori]MBT3059584.1 VWA domain-containing protein [Candidatus Thiodiazotropha sp. (ex Lucina pensylvanica)]MBV2093755.1 VWA domain-containing protein [Candidatus Thiodiazotropha sp. (ex Codakia orbicularis)]PUB80315.1 MAG: nitric oxide reductase [gamma proteobacterium symbiont of Ctena orbiculata]